MDKERCNLLERSDYSPKTNITRLTAWFGLRFLADGDLKDWRSSWQFGSRILALGVAQNDFWDSRERFEKRKLPDRAFEIWQKEVEPNFTFASFYRVLVEWIGTNYNGQERFVRKKILASWQKKACQLEMKQAKLNPENVGLDEGWKLREETICTTAWAIVSLACGREIPEDDLQFLGITKLILAAQIIDDIVGLGSDWKRNQITFATLILNHCQNEEGKDRLIETIKKGNYIPSKFFQKAPRAAKFLREKTNEYLGDLQECGLKLGLIKTAVKALGRYYPFVYTFIKEKRNNQSRLSPFLEFFPQTLD